MTKETAPPGTRHRGKAARERKKKVAWCEQTPGSAVTSCASQAVAGSLHTISIPRDALPPKLTEPRLRSLRAWDHSGLRTAAAKRVTRCWLPLPAPASRRHSEDGGGRGGGRASSDPLSAPLGQWGGEAWTRTILVFGCHGNSRKSCARSEREPIFVNPNRFRRWKSELQRRHFFSLQHQQTNWVTA